MRKKIPLIGGIINLIESLKGDIGIVENGDVATHSISAGSYVIWKNELYKASSAIAVDDALSSSNLTAVSGGVGSELNNKTIVNTETILADKAYSTSAQTYTVPEDCYFTGANIGASSIGDGTVKINSGSELAIVESGSSMKLCVCSGFAKAGDIISYRYIHLKFFKVR